MESSFRAPSAPPPLPPGYEEPRLQRPDGGGGALKRVLASLGFVGLLLLKFGAKLKLVLLPLLKFLPILLKTGGTMLLSIWAYAMFWGVWFAVGFVVLIFIHELGHLLAARSVGLKVGAPVFLPFMGAMIALKEAPRNAWIEAWVGIGGPILGSVGAGVCYGIYAATGHELFSALAYLGFFLNLFNLTPISPLDGGRIVTALSPWLWLVGLGVLGTMTYLRPNFLLFFILILSLPRLLSLFRARNEAEKRYFEVSPQRRLLLGLLYFGLAALLFWGMHEAHVVME